ncbi:MULTISPECIES: hypothetical protein [Pseudonocardia]|uniref:DUF4386 family protein n=2 Tax=Pseudonocardia TaxID=1847 RepID=A0A1Y2N6K6_PSEAH|nr:MULTISPECIES: hypothetical protein [Pseudonocardia]OSY42801.1 hypothetical protein BG845_01042 [Pseudonocardia autotrophica]TDN77378.1 hypothetical protein C8E95_6624 [Pseudonocardia autotrophica]BBG01401.1 hypothetical protein Pdca_26100 [Pseudonocardia autotrophica]GEC24457.1 hypothetical protein PSA01_14860 [Pseudonocardia saturnea]
MTGTTGVTPTTRLPGTPPAAARSAAAALVVAGLSFALLPPLFPHDSAEPGLVGAAATATTAWTVSHLFGMLALIALPLGVYGIRGLLGGSAGPAVLLTTAGCGLALPYYGAETFGAAAVAELALATGDVSLLSGVEAIRWGALPATFLATGMLVLAAAGVLIAVGVRGGGALPSWAGVPLAAGLVLFVPQFFAPPAVRVLHGVLLAAGCILLAVTALRPSGTRR